MTFLVYNSSAGSGKTFTLVREYIALALAEPRSFRHILAVTFTNKAANEMKERVVKGLFHLSEPSKFSAESVIKTLLPELAERLSCSKEEVSQKAGDALTAILHNYSDFSISTIDSFVNRVVRTFAHDLKLPLEFTVETDTDVLKADTIRALLNRVGVDQNLTGVLVNFVEESFESEDTANIEKLLLGISDELFKEDSLNQLERLNSIPLDTFLEIVKQVFAFRKNFENQLLEIGHAAIHKIDGAGVETGSFAGGVNGIGGFFEKLSKGHKLTMPENNKTAFKNFENNSWYKSGISADQKHGIDRIKDDLAFRMKQVIDLENKSGQQYRLFDIIHKTIYQLAVVNELDREMDAIKRDRNMLHISEFNRKVSAVVVSEPAPFIYERLGERYNNYLLDEFQDTSVLQWLNLLPLLSESISTGNFNLVVGDGKQAIYRWRNGDVEQFIRLPHLPMSFRGLPNFNELENALKSVFSGKELSTNYRSLPGIIHFNNRFFQYSAAYLDELGQEIYKNVEQEVVPGKSGGEVHVEFFKEKAKEQSAVLQLNRIVVLVREILEEGIYASKDIAVLVRKNSQGSEVAQRLLEEGFDVVSQESLLLSSSAEVRLLIALMKWLNNPADKITELEICRLLVLAGILAETDFESSAEQIAGTSTIITIFNSLGLIVNPDYLKSLSLYDLNEELIRLFAINDKVNPYVISFLEFVQSQSGKAINNLHDLLDIWEQEKDDLSLALPENMPAIRILTIHKAKGLEFPIVIYPFVEDPVEPQRNRLWLEINDPIVSRLPVTLSNALESLRNAGFEKELTEEIQKSNLDLVNLLYVALTRPVARLYVLARYPEGDLNLVQRGSKLSAHKLLGRFLTEEFGMNIDSLVFHYVEEGLQTKKTEKVQIEVIRLENNISEAWQENTRIANKSTLMMTPGDTQKARNWGNLVHDALSKIISCQDCDDAVSLMSRQSDLLDDEAAFLRKLIFQVVGHPELKSYFDPGLQLMRESAILTPNGEVYRPDRVVLYDENAVILDYKTGSPSDNNFLQIQGYADLLQQMGYVVEHKILVYLGEEIKVVYS